jgi:excisionase family DNA binding protein
MRLAVRRPADQQTKDRAMSETPQPNESAQHALEPLQVDVLEAARLLRYSRAKIYEMLSRGELPSTRHGASRRIPVMALRAWVEAHTEHGL